MSDTLGSLTTRPPIVLATHAISWARAPLLPQTAPYLSSLTGCLHLMTSTRYHLRHHACQAELRRMCCAAA